MLALVFGGVVVQDSYSRGIAALQRLRRFLAVNAPQAQQRQTARFPKARPARATLRQPKRQRSA